MSTAVLLNVWKWNLEQSHVAWKEKDYDGYYRHVYNAVKIEQKLNVPHAN